MHGMQGYVDAGSGSAQLAQAAEQLAQAAGWHYATNRPPHQDSYGGLQPEYLLPTDTAGNMDHIAAHELTPQGVVFFNVSTHQMVTYTLTQQQQAPNAHDFHNPAHPGPQQQQQHQQQLSVPSAEIQSIWHDIMEKIAAGEEQLAQLANAQRAQGTMSEHQGYEQIEMHKQLAALQASLAELRKGMENATHQDVSVFKEEIVHITQQLQQLEQLRTKEAALVALVEQQDRKIAQLEEQVRTLQEEEKAALAKVIEDQKADRERTRMRLVELSDQLKNSVPSATAQAAQHPTPSPAPASAPPQRGGGARPRSGGGAHPRSGGRGPQAPARQQGRGQGRGGRR